MDVILGFCSLPPTYKEPQGIKFNHLHSHSSFACLLLKCLFIRCEEWIVKLLCDCEVQGYLIFFFSFRFCALFFCTTTSLLFLCHYYCFVDVFSTPSIMPNLVPIGFVVIVPLCYCSIVVLLVLFMFGWYCPPFACVGNYGVWSSTSNPQQFLTTNTKWVFFLASHVFLLFLFVYLFFILLLPFVFLGGFNVAIIFFTFIFVIFLVFCLQVVADCGI